MKLLGFMNKSIKEKRYGFPLYGFEERGGVLRTTEERKGRKVILSLSLELDFD